MFQQALPLTPPALADAKYGELQQIGDDELIVDLFAAGGGISEAIEIFFGRSPDIAINHDPDAVNLHKANHPRTTHYCEDVFAVEPRRATCGRRVGLLHASPDCCHFSQARGGQPRSRQIRALSWVVLRWAGTVRPRIITLENVEEIVQWSPLVAKRDRHSGRVVKIDGTVALPGERTPVEQQFLVPCRRRRGQNWKRFINELRALGYKVEWRKLRACDFGAGTTRERLFLVARLDEGEICWPEPTHGINPPLKPFVRAADFIDFSLPCPSIFDRPKSLVPATLRRLAEGLKRFVIDDPQPFIVHTAHGERSRDGRPRWGHGEHSLETLLPVVTASNDFALVQPVLAAFMEQANTGMTGHRADVPLSTIVGKGCTQRLATAQLECCGDLSADQEAGALRVAAFLIQYYSEGGQWGDLRNPMPTITTKDRLALATVYLQGTPFVVVDIGLRLLTPRELFLAQGFPPDYNIDRGADGRRLSKKASVRMVGNSVSPPPYVALLRANFISRRETNAMAA